jgi:hypothetical protein
MEQKYSGERGFHKKPDIIKTMTLELKKGVI